MDSRREGLKEELEFQAKRARSIRPITPTPDHIFERYRRSSLPRIYPKEMLFRSLGPIEGKDLLDFGCGEGQLSTQLARLGAKVTGIDISPELIGLARQRAVADHVQDRTEFIVWDILEKPLPVERFDLVTCSAVLHHVNIRTFLPVLWASLKPGGKAAMIEPLGLSPFLRKLRGYVPVQIEASPGEHPLTRQELKLILSIMGGARLTYFELFSRVRVLLPAGRFNQTVTLFLGSIDLVLLGLLPFLRRCAGTVVIVGSKPRLCQETL